MKSLLCCSAVEKRNAGGIPCVTIVEHLVDRKPFCSTTLLLARASLQKKLKSLELYVQEETHREAA
jgi:hypothetical protein